LREMGNDRKVKRGEEREERRAENRET
jgi:hypothetical protein